MKKIDTIIFDFDGVIADTFDILYAIATEVTNPFTKEEFLAHHDGNVYEKPVIANSEETAQIRAQYKNRLSQSHISHAVGPIKKLAQDFRLFIVLSNDEAGIHAVLTAAEIHDCFERVLAYETHPSKIVKFGMLKDDLGVEFSKSVFVTDTLGDIREANEIGLRTIAETFGFHPRERLEQGSPYAIVDSREEILAAVKKLS